jgi:hypothetical protein
MIYATHQNNTNRPICLVGFANLPVDSADTDWPQIRARLFQRTKTRQRRDHHPPDHCRNQAMNHLPRISALLPPFQLNIIKIYNKSSCAASY